MLNLTVALPLSLDLSDLHLPECQINLHALLLLKPVVSNICSLQKNQEMVKSIIYSKSQGPDNIFTIEINVGLTLGHLHCAWIPGTDIDCQGESAVIIAFEK